MKLEKFNKNKKQKYMIIGGLVGILLVIGSIILYKTYAYYEEAKTYNVLQGKVGDYGYDVKLAVTLDGVKQDSVPARGLYKTEISCKDRNGNQVSTGSWDYNNWSLTVENLQYETKCNVAFTSNLTQEEYDKYIDAGIAHRRNTYRGKDITSYLTASGEDNLYTQISNGTFDDIYVGDKIVSNGVTWLVADIDNYLHTGDTELTQHHLTIIPATPLANSGMNSTDTTAGGYVGSEMYTGNITDSNKVKTSLPKLLDEVIKPAFSGHIIKYRNLLTSSVDNETSPAGNSKWTGMSNESAWYDRELDLMSEANIYGTIVWSSSGLDTGIDNRQYAIFGLKPEYINSYGILRMDYWFKGVSNSTRFAIVDGYGVSLSRDASNVGGIRPRFLIG